jgi:predicted Zn-dependent protease
VTGADICAEAGYNPWGLAWLFQDFQNADVRQIPQLLSDHPANGTRIQTLEKYFRTTPPLFPSSITTRNLRTHSAFQRMPLCSSCALRSKVVSNLGSDRALDR